MFESKFEPWLVSSNLAAAQEISQCRLKIHHIMKTKIKYISIGNLDRNLTIPGSHRRFLHHRDRNVAFLHRYKPDRVIVEVTRWAGLETPIHTNVVIWIGKCLCPRCDVYFKILLLIREEPITIWVLVLQENPTVTDINRNVCCPGRSVLLGLMGQRYPRSNACSLSPAVAASKISHKLSAQTTSR